MLFVKVQDDNFLAFERYGLSALVGRDHFFAKMKDAVNYIENQRAAEEGRIMESTNSRIWGQN